MTTLQMDGNLWSIADDLAYGLHERGVDVNEFDKVTAFMRQYYKADDALDKFKLLLRQLADSDDAPIQSRQTREYYKNIQECCQTHLDNINDPDELLLILGWCRRLMRYYKIEPKRAAEEQLSPQVQQQTLEQHPTQTPQLPKEPEVPEIKVPQRVNATVVKNDNFKVTVKLQTDNNEEVVFESSYYPHKVGKTVKLKVMSFETDGTITKVIP